jgi:5'(3')-deoxyribonucleotidase
MTNTKQIVWIDMDGVIVDFAGHVKETLKRNPHLVNEYAGREDHIHGIFRNPKPIDGAIEAINKLAESGKYELYIATACPWGNPEGATDKRYWIEEHFGNLFHKKMVITHLKHMLIGDYLIDDRTANGAGEFTGKHIHFNTNDYPNWESVLNELL